MYKPLTRQQYSNAINSGFSSDEILSMERKRKELATEKPGYFQSVAEDYKRIAGGITSGIQKGAEQVEKGGALNVIGGLARGSLRTVGGVAEAAFSPIVELPPVKKGLEAIGTGISKIPGVDVVTEKLTKLAKKHPEAAKDINNIINVAALGGGRIVEKPVGKALSKAGGKIEKSGVKSAEVAKRNLVLDLVKPIEDKATRLSQVPRTTETGKGILKKSVIAPTRAEIRAADEVFKIPKISEKNTFQQNFNIVQEYNVGQAKQLVDDITKYDFIFPKRELKARLRVATQKLADNPAIVGDAEKTAKKLVERLNVMLDGTKAKGSALLKLRKDYDKLVESFKGGKIFDPKTESAFSISNREIRQTINTFLDEKAPNLGIKDSLRSQSNLYNAMETLIPKAALEANTAIGRTMQSIGAILGTKSRIVQAVAAAVGIGGLGAAATFAPAAAAILGTGFVMYRGGRLILRPAVREALGKLLQKAGSQLNPADRSAIKGFLETYSEFKKNPQGGFQKLPALRNRKQGGTYQTPAELDAISREAARREAQLSKFNK